MSKITRRHFIQSATLLGGTSLLLRPGKASARAVGANNRLRVAVVGLNSRGQAHIAGWLEQPDTEIAYLVDPDSRVLARSMKSLEKKLGKDFVAKGVADIRDALADPDLDAISIAAPNHWHSLMTIWGAQAGKHVYVEKPMSHDIGEGRVVVEAQKKYGVVVQHGTQGRSNARTAGLHEAIHAGKFGRLKIAYGYCCKPRGSIKFADPATPPDHLDWDLWRGPAVVDDYHRNYVHYNWHWFWNTGNGDLNNQGTHQLDIARWAIDPDQTHPIRTMALGGRFQWHDQGETPNTMFSMAEYPNGQYVFFNVRNVNYDGYENQVENEYYFEDGGKIIRDKYYPKGSDKGEALDVGEGRVTPGGHWGSFVAACRAGDPSLANGNALEAHYGCVLGHLINNSYRLGQKVPFNLQAGKFGDNADAFEHFSRLHEIMSKGVGIPEDGNEYTVGPWLSFDPETESHQGDFSAEATALLKDVNRPGFEIPGITEL
ncbi:MAG: Gfo/Idh/MocA family oxidoreductase [Candidatus Hydrogenedens sp.]|jgi:predicted dehydrogenase|nr:Gfo/Idh/MocA family oxidoreductase [Candidatus Hydrogenedens sp.]